MMKKKQQNWGQDTLYQEKKKKNKSTVGSYSRMIM